jgi:methyl-accepting chemotaxis protein
MDLRHRMNEAIPETYATLRDNFNTASEQLDRALREVHRGAGEIQAGTQSIEQASRDLASRAEQQAANLEEAVAELGVLTTTVKKTAQGAAHAQERSSPPTRALEAAPKSSSTR